MHVHKLITKGMDDGAAVVQKSLSTLADQVKAFRGETETQVKAALSKLEKIDQAQLEFAQRLVAIEQSPRSGGAPLEHKSEPPSVIKSFLGSAQLKALREGAPTTGRVEMKAAIADVRKALLSYQGAQTTTNQLNVQADRLPGFGADPRRSLRLLDALPRIPVASNAVEYNRLHSSFAHAAAYQVYEGDTKAEQSVPTTLVTAPVRTIAAWVRGSRQVLSDDAMLQQQVSDLISYGTLSKLERELVVGAGGAGEISGLWTAGTALTTTGPQADRISSAIAQLQALGWNPSLILMHPTDWHEIRSERGTSNDGYVASGWNQPAAPSMWGLPVIPTPSLTANNCLVLDASQVAILDRESVQVMVSREDATNLTSNMVTILAELRAGLAIFSPGAVGKVTLA